MDNAAVAGERHALPGGSTAGEAIRRARVGLGWSLAELAQKVGCGRAYLCMIESGDRGGQAGERVDPELLGRIEAALGMGAGALTRAAAWGATPAGVRREVREMESSQRAAAAALRAVLGDAGRVGARGLDEAFRSGRLQALVTRLEAASGAIAPTLGPAGAIAGRGRGGAGAGASVPLVNSVAAGYPREFTDLGYPARMADEYVLTPGVDDPDAFAARVVGDSMAPDYREGDIVIFSPARAVKSGADCFVRLERDDETTFKRVVIEGAAGAEAAGGAGVETIRLVALNPAYPERAVRREDVAFMCPAVSVTRRIG